MAEEEDKETTRGRREYLCDGYNVLICWKDGRVCAFSERERERWRWENRWEKRNERKVTPGAKSVFGGKLTSSPLPPQK